MKPPKWETEVRDAITREVGLNNSDLAYIIDLISRVRREAKEQGVREGLSQAKKATKRKVSHVDPCH